MQFTFFFNVSTRMSILFSQYELGFDPFLVGNGFHYFYFCLILLTLFIICVLYICIYIFIDFYNPRINKVIMIIKTSHLNRFFDENNLTILIKTRSSYRRCSMKKVLLKNSQMHRKTPV